jgi:hypothetical protein
MRLLVSLDKELSVFIAMIGPAHKPSSAAVIFPNIKNAIGSNVEGES